MPLKGKRKKSYNKTITNKTRMKYMSAGRKFTTKFRKKSQFKAAARQREAYYKDLEGR